MFEGKKVEKGIDNTSPPRRPEAEKAFRLAQALAHGEIRASDLVPDPAIVNNIAHEAAISDRRTRFGTKEKPEGSSKILNPRLLKDAARRAKSNEARIPDLFE
jgi:hypothetical protein